MPIADAAGLLCTLTLRKNLAPVISSRSQQVSLTHRSRTRGHVGVTHDISAFPRLGDGLLSVYTARCWPRGRDRKGGRISGVEGSRV